MKYLAIKNWDKYQVDQKGVVVGNGDTPPPWIKMYTARDSDPDYIKLTFYQRYVLDALCRLRALHRQNIKVECKECYSGDTVSIQWDISALSRQLYAARSDASHLLQCVCRLISVGFLIVCNEAHSFGDKTETRPDQTERETETRLDERSNEQNLKPSEEPEMRPDSAFVELLDSIGEASADKGGIYFSKKQKGALYEVYEQYGSKLMFEAFQDFYSQQDKWSMQWNRGSKGFVEQCSDRCRVLKKHKEKEAEAIQAGERGMEEFRDRMAALDAEIKAKQDAADKLEAEEALIGLPDPGV
jgi:hypothetical protein